MSPESSRSDSFLWYHEKPCPKILRIDLVRGVSIENSRLYGKGKITKNYFGIKNLNTENVQFPTKIFIFEEL